MVVLFFTSPIGLGHATRDIAICEKLRSLTNDKILFVTGSAAYTIISNKGYVAYDVYTPNNFQVNYSMHLQSMIKWLIQYVSYYKRCKIIAQQFIEKNNERNLLIVSDEDFASITVGKNRNMKRILITDILKTHFLKGLPSIIEYGMNRSLERMIRSCDHVIIPDYGSDVDNKSYIGPIVRELTTIDREALRKKFEMYKPTILLTIGGTTSGKYLIEMTIKAFKKLRMKLDINLLIVSGLSVEVQDKLLCTSNTDNIINLGFVNNLHEYIYASDLVVSLAGRSTIDESIVYKTPGIFIPIKNHFEQEENARRMGYNYEDIFRLESLITEKFNKMSLTANDKNITQVGSEKAAKIILETLESQ
ncbi:MAG: glycosyltransferase [Nitrososphaeraceae archaeon]|jgi:UDP-N-acetylglucosamine--N-acetylmuramyl-(pentapeptide) pyrophosphoryl-undecaprenol N-acetylglucosamine transferase